MKQKRRKKQKQSPAINTPNDSSPQLSQTLKPIPPGSFKSRSLFWILPSLIAINLFIYMQVRRHEFTHWDDPYYVSQNFEVSHGLTWEGVRWAFTTGHNANWHPLTWLSYMLDVQLFGITSGAHHLINVLFHSANTLLLFWILFRMTAAIGQSSFVAGLFAAHPLHVESVAWISERKDVLCMFFLLLAIWAYIAYVRKATAYRYFWVAALFTLALMAKPMAITLPLILLLLDIWPFGRFHPGPGQWPACFRLIREKALFIMLAIASSIATILAQSHGGSVVKMDVIPLSSRAANALASYVAYLGNMLWPAGLSAFYPYSSLPVLWIVGCFLALAGVSAMAVRLAGRHPFFLVGWMWYLATLVPVIGLIQVGSQAKADRYTYLPLIGIFIVIAWGVPEMLGRLPDFKIPLAIAGSVIICALAVAARSQAGYWVNGVALWDHAVKVYPGSYLAHLNLGNEFYNRGEDAKAMQHLSEALRLSPNSPEAHYSIGVELAKQGHAAEASEHFDLALRMKPNYADARRNLGARLADLGKTDEAMSHLTTDLSMNANDPMAHYEMGIALFKQGNNDEAIAHFSEALRLKPNFADAYYWCGNALSNKGKQDEAIVQYKDAIRIKPDFADAHNNWGTALAIQGKLDEAINQYKEALRIKPDKAEAHNGLANALLRQGKLDEAAGHYKEAFRIAPNYAEAHQDFGVSLASQGKMDEATAQYKEALRIKPDLAEAYRSLGDVYLFRKQIDEAIAQYKEAVRVKPRYVEARYNMGIALVIKGRYDEAIVHLTEVLRMSPENIGAHANLGIALMKKGKEAEAIPHLKEVLRVKPGDKNMNALLKKATKK
jgi:protein O-mannosyl-transferase